jgi:uncharacterized membrane protein YcfT
MHSTLGVEAAANAEGWAHTIVAFATPFRMPDFFMISGLFLPRVINRDWRDYLDRKVVHFGYFYLLWLTIQFAFKAPEFAAAGGGAGAVVRLYLVSLIDPFGTIWFIYLLPIFFVVAKAAQRVPWWIIWPIGAALEISHVTTGWVVPDEFASRFIYFSSGYIFSPIIFRYAATALQHTRIALTYLAVWAIIEGVAVFSGVSALPFVSLFLGFIGAIAVITFATLLSKSDLMRPVRTCGRNSIVIYLAFFLPMATARVALLRLGVIPDLGTVSLMVTACGVVCPLALFWVVRATSARFLFERPTWARLMPVVGRLQPAE